MKLPTDLPPELPEDIPYDLWLALLEHGVSKHMLEWRQEGMKDEEVIILALQMIDAACTRASWTYQKWLEIQFGKSRSNMYNVLLRRAATWITISLDSLSPVKPRDYGIPVNANVDRWNTYPMNKVATERKTD